MNNEQHIDDWRKAMELADYFYTLDAKQWQESQNTVVKIDQLFRKYNMKQGKYQLTENITFRNTVGWCEFSPTLKRENQGIFYMNIIYAAKGQWTDSGTRTTDWINIR